MSESPFRRVVDDLTGGCGCACHTGIGYNTACSHCQPPSAHPEDSASLPAESTGQSEALLRDVLEAVDRLIDGPHQPPTWLTSLTALDEVRKQARAALQASASPNASEPLPPAEPRDCDHDDIESTFSLDEPPGQREEWLYCRACNTHWQPRAGVLKLLEQRAAVEPPPDPLDVAHARGFREGHRAAAEGSEPSSD